MKHIFLVFVALISLSGIFAYAADYPYKGNFEQAPFHCGTGSVELRYETFNVGASKGTINLSVSRHRREDVVVFTDELCSHAEGFFDKTKALSVVITPKSRNGQFWFMELTEAYDHDEKDRASIKTWKLEQGMATRFQVSDDCRNQNKRIRVLNIRFPFSDELAGHMNVPVTSRVVLSKNDQHTCEF